MIIKDIRLINFGKFHDTEIHFERGLNIVYGENEAGKTTIHTFIRGMLFGIDKQRGKASGKDTYTKYEPWINPEVYRGMMRVENDGKDYRFERNFNKNEKSFRVIDEDLGRELDDNEIKQLFRGLDESCYYNTISISQIGSATDKELENILKNYAANLGSTKSMEIDMKQALTSLDAERKEIISENKVGSKESVIRDMEETAEEIEMSKREQDTIISEIDLDRSKEAELLAKKQDLAGKDAVRLEEMTKYSARKENLYNEIMQLNHEIDKASRTLTEITAQKGEMEKQLESKGIPTREVMERVSNALNKATNIPIVFALITVVCLGCSIGMFMANPELLDFSSKGILKIGIPAGLALAFLIATIVKFFMNVKSKERLAENLKETKLIMNKLDALNNEKTYTERQLDNRRANLSVAKESLKNLEESELSSDDYSEEIKELDEEYAVLKEKIGKEQGVLEQKQEQDIELEKHIENLKAKLQSIKNAEIEIRALENAKREIEEIAYEVRNSFGRRLNEKASCYMSKITNGKYNNIVIDDNLNVSVNGRNALISSFKLSKGTVEQIYMALRLAAADIIFENDTKPILLDDTFAMYDNKRMGNTMKFMAENLDQVIVFSCHTREKVMADKLGLDYHLKKLD